ncbi:DUF924 family protein [Luteimonas sp. BDR2-5]|uniref:DUF924 family protein n=1 Tax=Proluteimonas luteida TaxID=2878685 RepID=UPI001E57412F|nr:DUF924 family protein [Luteimonas sp. BDR2-5]MCD9028772.1 DUF924 family protein [Luteimonas sp. BDR2-5]
METISADEVIGFWRQAGQQKWFNGGEAFDRECDAVLRATHFAAARRELDGWLDSADGGLALLLLLDQIPRNIFRGSAHAFATDPLALHFARRFVDAGLDRAVDDDLRAFVYLPFEHSEAFDDQHRSVALFDALGNAEYRKYAQAHLDVIAEFGRFPHRNRALGRTSTPGEQAWLDAGGGF